MKVVALEKFEYANKLRMPGDSFDTDNDEHARLLALAKRVKIATVETRHLKAGDESLPENAATEHAAVNKRNRYSTRRLRADE